MSITDRLDQMIVEAIYDNNIPLAKGWIDSGANVNAQDEKGMTALHYAAMHGKEAILSRLIAAGAKVNAPDEREWTPLHYAAWKGQEAAVSRLIAARAKVNAQDKKGQTALYHAVSHGEAAIVSQLIAAGADVNLPDNDGKTPLDLPYYGSPDSARDIAHQLKEAGQAQQGQPARRFASFATHVIETSAQAGKDGATRIQ